MKTGKEIAIQYLEEVYKSEIKLSYFIVIACISLSLFSFKLILELIYLVLLALVYWKYRVDSKKKLKKRIELINNMPDEND